MRKLFAEIEVYAPSAARILIRGERGTGKELVARAIHQLSRRRDATYLTVNCAEFSPDLLASELFGHERGAFTGATERRSGLFALAHGGTLFADEIGTLALEGQAKLLRAIELGEVRPVGGRGPPASTSGSSPPRTGTSSVRPRMASSCRTSTIG